MSRPRNYKTHLYDEVAELARLCRGKPFVPEPLRSARASLGWRTRLDELEALRAAFYAMPEADQRRALTGWRPAPVRLPRETLATVQGDMPVIRGLRLTPVRGCDPHQ